MNNTGSSNLFTYLPTPKSKFPKPKPVVDDERDKEAVKRARLASFAVAHELKPRLEKAGITENNLWDYIKDKHGVDSRKQFDEQQWVRIEARLRAASKSSQLFYILVEKINVWKENQHDTGASQEHTGDATE